MSATVFYASASELATLTNSFYVASVLTDPTTISLAVTSPSGTTTTYTYAGSTITKTSTGIYTKNIACSEAGEWVAVWTGTGTASDVVEVRWTVFATNANLYCSVESLKSRFGISDTVDDFELQQAVRSASRWVEGHCGRERFWRDATVQERTFPADSAILCRVPVGISTLTGLIVKTDEDGDGTFERTLTIDTDFLVRRPLGHEYDDGWPYTQIELADNYTFPIHRVRHGVQIFARFGWPTILDDIRQATTIQSHVIFKDKESSTGVAGFDGMGAVVRIPAAHPRVLSLLSPYRVYAVA